MKLFLIDSNSYIYRFYHAIKGLSTSKGFPTNGLYGFTGMLLKLLRESSADAIVAVFDRPEPTHRHATYAEYKANRPSMPEDLSVQLPVLKDIIKGLGIEVLEIPGFEADDIIGTLAKKAARAGWEVYILSTDKDMLQLVDDKISIYDYHRDIYIDRQYVVERFGVEPHKIPDIMALTGDSTDNIPGVKGIGEKKARELIQKSGSIEALISDLDKVKNEKLKGLIKEHIDLIRLSKGLATIDTAVPLDIDLKDLTLKDPSWNEVRRLFRECEFRAYLKMIPHTEGGTDTEVRIIQDRETLLDFLRES